MLIMHIISFHCRMKIVVAVVTGRGLTCFHLFVRPLPVSTLEGTIGLPSTHMSVCPSIHPSVCPLKS